MYWLRGGVRHGVDDEPPRDLLEPSARRLVLRKLRVGRVEGRRRVAAPERRLRPHEPLHLAEGGNKMGGGGDTTVRRTYLGTPPRRGAAGAAAPRAW